MSDVQRQVTEAMERLSRTIERAERNPQGVLDGGFRGRSRSGRVTLWVDAMGRPERVRLTRGWIREGDEQVIADEFAEAIVAALHAADNLEFPDHGEQTATPPRPTGHDEESWENRGYLRRR